MFKLPGSLLLNFLLIHFKNLEIILSLNDFFLKNYDNQEVHVTS